jgi:hypothetical protein
MNIANWEKAPPLKMNWVRLLSPEGDIHDLWRGYLEGALEASDEPLRVFRSQQQWNAFLAQQTAVEGQWSMRETFTAFDREFLSELKVGW